MPGGGKKGGNPNQGQQGGNKKGGNDKSDFKFDFGGKAPQMSKEATAALLPVLQQKLGNLVGQSSGYLETLPQSVQKRVAALKNIQAKHDSLEAEFKKEREALEKKYDDLKNPLYARRSEIVKGESEPTEAELVKKEGEAEAPKSETKADTTDVKGIPEFWSTVLKHNDDFNQMIEPEDEEALKHLIEIKCSSGNNNDVAPSFTLEFHFTPNAYFEETLLKKTYHLTEDPTYGDIMFDNVESTEITWKAGKNLTVKKVTKKEGGGGRGGKRGGRAGPPKMVTVEEPCNSFFRFFSLIPDETEVEDEDELQDILESDYELGLAIKTQVIPNAVMFFTGEMNEGLEGEFDDEDGEDDDEDDDEEGPEGEDDDEDDDEEFDPSSAQATAGNGQAQPECKQQ